MSKQTDHVEKTIRLGQFLKLKGIVHTGGDGKILILDGKVSVNGQVCLQRGCHLKEGDVVSVDGKNFTVTDLK